MANMEPGRTDDHRGRGPRGGMRKRTAPRGQRRVVGGRLARAGRSRRGRSGQHGEAVGCEGKAGRGVLLSQGRYAGVHQAGMRVPRRLRQTRAGRRGRVRRVARFRREPLQVSWKEHNLPFPMVADESAERRAGRRGVPSKFLIDVLPGHFPGRRERQDRARLARRRSRGRRPEGSRRLASCRPGTPR